MIYEKPKNEIFASDAKDGEIVDFPNVKRGWGVTENLGFIPPMEYFNAAFNRVDKSIAYQLQRGVAEWDKNLEYPIGAVASLSGVVYVAKSQNTNKNPANEATIWDIVATQKWSKNQFLEKTELPTLATEEKAGIAKLKNVVNAKQTDTAVTEKAVSDAIERISAVITDNYVKLPGGFIVQWGKKEAPNSSGKTIFPIAFPNKCLHVMINQFGSAAAQATNEQYVQNKDNAGFTRLMNTWSFYWVAFGY